MNREMTITLCRAEIKRLGRENNELRSKYAGVNIECEGYIKEIQELREALKVCAVALKEIDDDLKENMPEYERLDSTNKALALPAVQQALKEKQDGHNTPTH